MERRTRQRRLSDRQIANHRKEFWADKAANADRLEAMTQAHNTIIVKDWIDRFQTARNAACVA